MASHAFKRPITVYGAIAAVVTGSAARLAENLQSFVEAGNDTLLLGASLECDT